MTDPILIVQAGRLSSARYMRNLLSSLKFEGARIEWIELPSLLSCRYEIKGDYRWLQHIKNKVDRACAACDDISVS